MKRAPATTTDCSLQRGAIFETIQLFLTFKIFMRFMQWMERSWGMSVIECCSNIFPIPLNPTKVCLRLIVVWRLRDWQSGWLECLVFTALDWPVLGWVLACQQDSVLWGHHCLMFPSCPLIICWKAISDNLLYGNIRESITFQDSWQLLLCLAVVLSRGTGF